MKRTALLFAGITILYGCTKVDDDVCWKPETKDAALAVAQSKTAPLAEHSNAALRRLGIDVFSKSAKLDLKLSDYSLVKIDQETGSADCTAKLSSALAYNTGNSISATGIVRFFSRNGEHGRYVQVQQDDVLRVVDQMR